jgi:cysteine desulfurase / selenocysteine lyase
MDRGIPGKLKCTPCKVVCHIWCGVHEDNLFRLWIFLSIFTTFLYMNSEIDWKAIAAGYVVNDTFIWLNNAGSVPPGIHLIKAMNEFMDTYARRSTRDPSLHFAGLHARIKSYVSPLLGCTVDDVALIHNTAEGINFISHGLPFETGDEILLMEQEYPSNVYPWEHLKEKGITLSFIPRAFTPRRFLNNFKNSLTSRTKAAALSAVHWISGMPLPLKKIGALCAEENIKLIVDISQGAGHIPLHLDEWGISLCAGSAWKWLQGPPGLGILMIKKEKLHQLSHVFKGTLSVVSSDTYLPYKETLKPTVDRYVYSTPGLMDWAYFEASLKFLHGIGFEAIHTRIIALSDYFVDHLVALGFSVLNRRFEPVKSGIIVAEHGNISSQNIVRKLKALNIICAERGGRVRFSVHICNTFEQIDTVISILKEIV